MLIYHRVGARTEVPVDLPRSLFRRQMELIADRVISIDAALERLADPAPVSQPGPVVVTFDDGTADFVDEALPVLVELRIPITYYVASAFIEEQRPFFGNGQPMSWDALSDALSTGLVTVGSHSDTHLAMGSADEATAATDLDRSIDRIERRLGVRPAHYAYPDAIPPGSAALAALVRSRFQSASLAGSVANVPGATDRHALARSPVQRVDGTFWFRRRAAGGLGADDRVREMIRSRRRA
jgi:peptidoglycan/xylan/chitin deacetylase (PgdA/CDA1 family)